MTELLRLVVHRKERAAEGVVAVELRAGGGGTLPAWEPGAHIDLKLGNGLVRQYSLCGDATDRTRWRVAVLREPGGLGGSRHVHDELSAGDALVAAGPRNRFRFEPAERHVLIAGGIGVTPLLPMAAAAARAGTPWRLVYGGRSRASMAFADELAALGPRVRLLPRDEYGPLDLAAILPAPEPGTLVYCCGPAGLLAAVARHCAGWPAGAVRVERFDPRLPAPMRPRRPFEVELRRSGLTIAVGAGQTLLAALRAHGVGVPSSCGRGVCGTCRTPVLAGAVDHRDSVLTPAEHAADTAIQPCVSRALGDRLVLDL